MKNNINPLTKLLFAAGGGLAGFFVLLVAWLAFWRIVIDHLFGSSLSLLEILVILCLIPAVIAFGASIPARVLCGNSRRSLLAGIVAMLVFILVDVRGASINYAPFVEYETVAFIIAALISVLIATIERNKLQTVGIIIELMVAIILTGLWFIFPGKAILFGFVFSLVSWITLPVVATFVINSKIGDGAGIQK